MNLYGGYLLIFKGVMDVSGIYGYKKVNSYSRTKK